MVSVHGPAVSAIYFGVGGYLLVMAAGYFSEGVDVPVLTWVGLKTTPFAPFFPTPFESCSDISDTITTPPEQGSLNISLADFQLACSTGRLGYILAGVLSLIGCIVCVVGSIVHATAKDQAKSFKSFICFIIGGAFFLLGMSVVSVGNANRMGNCRSAAKSPFSLNSALLSDSTNCTHFVLSAVFLVIGAVGALAFAGLAFSPKRSTSFAIAGGVFGLGFFLFFTAVEAFYEADGVEAAQTLRGAPNLVENFRSSLNAQGAFATIAGLVCVVGAIFECIQGIQGKGKAFTGSFSEMSATESNPSIKV